LLESIKGRGQQPDVTTLSAAISACAKGGWWQQALELLEWMKARGL
jgi:pentatricopeptide repeat protein